MRVFPLGFTLLSTPLETTSRQIYKVGNVIYSCILTKIRCGSSGEEVEKLLVRLALLAKQHHLASY